MEADASLQTTAASAAQRTEAPTHTGCNASLNRSGREQRLARLL